MEYYGFFNGGTEYGRKNLTGILIISTNPELQ